MVDVALCLATETAKSLVPHLHPPHPPNPESDKYGVEAIQERFKACQSQRSVLSFSENLRKEQSIYNKPQVHVFVPLPPSKAGLR